MEMEGQDIRGNGDASEGFETPRNCLDEPGDAVEKESLEPKCDGVAMIRTEWLRRGIVQIGTAQQRKSQEKRGKGIARNHIAWEMNSIDMHENKKSPLLLEQERGQEPQPQRKGPFLHYTADWGGNARRSYEVSKRYCQARKAA